MYTVYLLHCPISLEPRYVGLTRLDIEVRLAAHISESGSQLKAAWIDWLWENWNARPLVKPLYFTDCRTDGLKHERHFMGVLADQFALVNEEARERVSNRTCTPLSIFNIFCRAASQLDGFTQHSIVTELWVDWPVIQAVFPCPCKVSRRPRGGVYAAPVEGLPLIQYATDAGDFHQGALECARKEDRSRRAIVGKVRV